MAGSEVNREAVEAHAAAAGDGPVHMLNLIKFKSQEHAERFFAGSAEMTVPHLENIGGGVTYAGFAGPELIEGADWDAVLLIRYPNFGAFAEIGNSLGSALAELRADTIERTQLIATTPIVVPEG